MDPDTSPHYMRDKRRLTAERVAGFALEVAFKWAHALGLFGLQLKHVAMVKVDDVAPKRPEATKRSATFAVKDVHQQAVCDATADILPRFNEAGFVVVGVVVPQKDYPAAHDLVLEHRIIGAKCHGQYTCELKLRTLPANRTKMRSDSAGLFQVACRSDAKWLGQLVVVAEIDSRGRFVQSRAELLMEDRPRSEPLNLWGWGGRPCAGPPTVDARGQQSVKPPVLVSMRASPPPMMPVRPPLPPKPSWATVWSGLTKYNAGWSAPERVVLLKAFFAAMGPRYAGKVKNVDRVIV